jgi:hypothetical protein
MYFQENQAQTKLAQALLLSATPGRVSPQQLTGALDHELRPPAVELNLLGERLVLQGSCAFLALLIVSICLHFVCLMLSHEIVAGPQAELKPLSD